VTPVPLPPIPKIESSTPKNESSLLNKDPKPKNESTNKTTAQVNTPASTKSEPKKSDTAIKKEEVVANKTNPKNETKEAKKDESKVLEQKKEENKTDPAAPI
jgi:hypothetical protein